MGTTGDSKGGKASPAGPAVVGTGRSMRARDVSKPRQPVHRRPVLPKTNTETDSGSGSGTDAEQDDQGSGGSSPVDS
ncbi:hypothetical protein JOF29_007419 [Kribbella aluminosa]|uniref:Uncharacterized protein n=1 Tax=Kribbella aluminosa TaxID=416017 RepID=A0ABS4UXD9_9ACTN|nr:hypothetical protein [Kribbella aluminosa]MBP2356309.1 hypothetical protein [Kribbella aluminosa]